MRATRDHRHMGQTAQQWGEGPRVRGPLANIAEHHSTKGRSAARSEAPQQAAVQPSDVSARVAEDLDGTRPGPGPGAKIQDPNAMIKGREHMAGMEGIPTGVPRSFDP